MSLSVVIASYNSHETLERCLESVVAQPAADEIIVADCSSTDPACEFGSRFPTVRFIHFDEPRTIPELRWAAYAYTTGAIVAATEGRCIPSSNWCAELVDSHKSIPLAPAIGGPIAVSYPASAFDLGLYFCEYGLHCPPIQVTQVRIASGANISYKRKALEGCRDLIETGAWETLLHERWLSQGLPLMMSSAPVVFENGMGLGTAVRQRYHYGRGYAADRVKRAPRPTKLVYAVLCSLLPALMTLRLGRIAFRRGRGADFLRGAAWIFLLSVAWSVGEMAGYLFGHGAQRRIF